MRSRFLAVLALAGVGALLVGVLRRPPPQRSRPSGPALVREAPQLPPRPPAPVAETGCRDACREDFTTLVSPQPSAWTPDVPDRATPFSDDGSFFHARHPAFAPPQGYRVSTALGTGGFLTLELYSRSPKDPGLLARRVTDPADPSNQVLQIASPEHTDGVLLRTSRALGRRYQICARVGYLNVGTGDGLNGYHGGEQNEPWQSGDGDATNENGCYLAALYRSVPQPHNNLFAHQERLAFIDTDNNTEGWTRIWDPGSRQFVRSGWHPLMIAAVDGRGASGENGPPIVSYAAEGWNQPGQLLAADAYQDNTWYTVCIVRRGNQLTLRLSGTFRYGGRTTYEAMLADTSAVVHGDALHYWALGDPHINYYEGSLLVDDVTLTVWDDR